MAPGPRKCSVFSSSPSKDSEAAAGTITANKIQNEIQITHRKNSMAVPLTPEVRREDDSGSPSSSKVEPEPARSLDAGPAGV